MNIHKGRQTVGIDIILGASVCVTQGRINEASLLDIGIKGLFSLVTDRIIGCGTGNYAFALSPYFGKITGFDYNSGMLGKARAKLANCPNVEFLQGSASNLPFPKNYCDVVISTQVSFNHNYI